jgi:hypothetical protein
MTMSTYPTTAELDALRYAIDPDAIDCAAWHHRGDGARDHELHRGIGYRLSDRGNLIWSAYDRGTDARQSAAALRHDAFERATSTDASSDEGDGLDEPCPECGETLPRDEKREDGTCWWHDDEPDPVDLVQHAGGITPRE